jgi:hypothetical protein
MYKWESGWGYIHFIVFARTLYYRYYYEGNGEGNLIIHGYRTLVMLHSSPNAAW